MTTVEEARTTHPDPDVQAIIDAVAGSVGDVSSARSLPAEAYLSPRFYEFEKEAIFSRSWLFLCHVSQVAEPGDVLAVTVADEPLIVSRDEAGVIHVLSAVCQHRGYVIAEEDGKGKNLRCPYHYWTYGLDGRLLGAPSMAPAHDLAELKATIRLPELRVEVWEGLVFANLDPEAEPLAATIPALTAEVLPYRIADLVVADVVTIPDLPFNWKNMQENALEEYHTTYVHRGFHENAPADRVRHADFAPGDGAIYRHAGLIIPGGEPVPNRPTFPVIDGLPDAYRRFFLFVAIPPLLFAAIRPDGIKLFRITPDGVDRMTLTISFLFPPSTLGRDDFPELMAGQLGLIEKLDQPDIESNTRMYRGLRSAYAPRGPLSPQESSLPQLNEWLLERYQAATDVVLPTDGPVRRSAVAPAEQPVSLPRSSPA